MRNRLSVFLIIILISMGAINSYNLLFVDNSKLSIKSLPTSIYLTNPSIQSNYNGYNIGIIVEPMLWAGSYFRTFVNQYLLDLNLTGYKTFFSNNTFINASSLKVFLQNWYVNNSVSGVVFIGNLPFALFYHPASGSFLAETFVCDLYFMDLDGNWTDTNPVDGIYDGHTAGSGDIYPEIFIARIDASSRTLGGLTNAQNIINLLNRTHNYYTGGVSRSHRALTYIDDDWKAWADGTVDNWPGWLQPIYSNRTDVHTPTTWTNASDWLNNRLTQDYEWTHLCAHSGSSPPQHYFGPGGVGEGTVTSAQIHAVGPTFNFYNLFCCHGADWLMPNCLATTYLFSSNYSLCVVSTTKTGGMLGGTSFYNFLGQNRTIGQSFYQWFQGMQTYVGQYLEWFYGMCIFGDPFLTCHYDCTIFQPDIYSPTHPDWGLNYSNNKPDFQWNVPLDVNGIVGYYYILDQFDDTLPTKANGIFTTNNYVNISTPLNNGKWYFHLVAEDGAGNIGVLASHYIVNIYVESTSFLKNPIFWACVGVGAVLLISIPFIFIFRKRK